MKRLTVLLLLAIPLAAESPQHKLLRWSWGALLAGNAADAASSWGRAELNPVLGPQFGARSTAIKFGIVGAVVVSERFLVRRHPASAPSLVIGNFATGAALGSVAVRNWRMRP